MQVKKYSFGFDIFDFTARAYSEKNVRMTDVEEQEIKKVKAKRIKKTEDIGGSKTITESSSAKAATKPKHFTKAGD